MAARAKKDPRVDDHIRKAAPFAQPVLKYLRGVVHANCPGVEETLKWGMPHFLHDGKILCGMGAFKSHCAFWFWNGDLVMKGARAKEGMGQLGKIRSLADLPSKRELASFVKKAVAVGATGASPIKRREAKKKTPVRAPADLLRALRANRDAHATYEAFAPSHKREYAEWIAGAKTEATRERRLETAIDWMAEGKKMGWKYERKR